MSGKKKSKHKSKQTRHTAPPAQVTAAGPPSLADRPRSSSPESKRIDRRGLLAKILAAACLLLLGQGALWGIQKELQPADASLAGLSLQQWPLELPGWHGARTTLADEVVRHSEANAMGNWVYQNAVGEQVLVHAGIWCHYETELPHPPELCYAGAGYELRSSRVVEIDLPGQAPVPAELYQFERQQQPVMVLAWYQFGEDTLLERDELRRLRQSVRSTTGQLPPAIKIMLQAQADDPARAEEQLLSVARLLRLHAAPLQATSQPADAPAGQ